MVNRTLVLLAGCALSACGGPTRSTAQPSPQPSAGATAQPPAVEVVTGSIEAAIAGPHRSAANRARDRYRHPRETLELFGLTPGMTVVEIWPGRGWYTEILAPVLRDHGRLIAADFDPANTSFQGRFGREYREWLAHSPALYDQVEPAIMFPPDHFEIAEPGSADMVLTFRSIHNWVRWEGFEPEPFFEAVARALKPGGVFGVVQHRAASDVVDADTAATTGYMPEAWVIAQCARVGLQLDVRSEINANQSDTRDHPNGVWSLPPTLRGGDEGSEGFVAIGESDRMTLRFVKRSP